MKGKVLLSCIALLFALTSVSLAQPPATLWQVIHGGSSQDYCNDVLNLEDGFIFAGSTLSYGAGDDDMYLVKTDFDGNIIWEQTYGTTEEEECLSIAQSSDGGFVLAGYICYSTGPKDIYLVKTDWQGNLQWERIFDNGQFDVCESVKRTQDDGYILGGYTYTGSDEDMIVIKTDSQGNQTWMQTYGGPDFDRCMSCLPTLAGGYALAGYRYWFGPNGANGTLIKINELGVIQWEQNLPGLGCTYVYDAELAHEDGFVLTGATSLFAGFANNVYLLKTDGFGNTEWEHNYGQDMFDEYGNAVLPTSEGGFLVAGCAYINMMTEYQMYALKTDAQGNQLWTNHWGGMAWEEGKGVSESTEGSYIMGGFTNSPPTAQAFDMLLVCMDTGTQSPEFIVELTYQSGSPVPAGGGDLYFDVYVENVGTVPAAMDAWLDISYESQDPVTVVQRFFEDYQPGWSINRPNTFYPIPAAYAPGNYIMAGRVGIHPEEIWAESSFPFEKLGSTNIGSFAPYPVAGAPNPFDMIETGDIQMPDQHALLSSYPNPFNPETTLRYTLAENCHVKLAIYNTIGQEIVTLVDRFENAGSHRINWSGEQYPAGVYFARLTAGKAPAQMQKLILVK